MKDLVKAWVKFQEYARDEYGNTFVGFMEWLKDEQLNEELDK